MNSSSRFSRSNRPYVILHLLSWYIEMCLWYLFFLALSLLLSFHLSNQYLQYCFSSYRKNRQAFNYLKGWVLAFLDSENIESCLSVYSHKSSLPSVGKVKFTLLHRRQGRTILTSSLHLLFPFTFVPNQHLTLFFPKLLKVYWFLTKFIGIPKSYMKLIYKYWNFS